MYDESHVGNKEYSYDYVCPHCGYDGTDYDGYCVKCGEKVVTYEDEVTEEDFVPERSLVFDGNFLGHYVCQRFDYSNTHLLYINSVMHIRVFDRIENFILVHEEEYKDGQCSIIVKNESKLFYAQLMMKPNSEHTLHDFVRLMSSIGNFEDKPIKEAQKENKKFSRAALNEDHKRYVEYEKQQAYIDNTNAVYRYSILGDRQVVKCPRCGSTNCSILHETKEIPDKIKTSYKANLNPFKPFTIANKKEKVVRKGYSTTITKYSCNKCGMIFN